MLPKLPNHECPQRASFVSEAADGFAPHFGEQEEVPLLEQVAIPSRQLTSRITGAGGEFLRFPLREWEMFKQ